jgi:hypothetical protein
MPDDPGQGTKDIAPCDEIGQQTEQQDDDDEKAAGRKVGPAVSQAKLRQSLCDEFEYGVAGGRAERVCR